LCIQLGSDVRSKSDDLGRTSLRATQGAVFAAAVPSKTKAAPSSKKHNRTKISRCAIWLRCAANWYGSKDRIFSVGFATNAAWVFKPSGTLGGRSLDEMKENYEQQRDKEFNLMSVPSTREPQKIPVSQITRGLSAV